MKLDSSLMLYTEEGLVHVLDRPEIYESLSEIEIPRSVQGVLGTELDLVKIVFFERTFFSGYTQEVLYVLPQCIHHGLLLSREEGIQWVLLENPICQ